MLLACVIGRRSIFLRLPFSGLAKTIRLKSVDGGLNHEMG
jgi:hypothetical protein